MMFKFDLQLFGGIGGLFGSDSGSSTNTVEMSPEARKLANYALDYAEKAAPITSGWLSRLDKLSQKNYGLDNDVDFAGLVAEGQNKLNESYKDISNLSKGILPDEYQKNMASAIKDTIDNTIGSYINQAGARGVVNSSVTTKMNDTTARSVANAAANQYTQGLNTLANLSSQKANQAADPLRLVALGQSAAYQPLSNLLGMSTGLQQTAINSPLSALMATNSSTQQRNSNDGWSNALALGLAFL